MPLPHALPHDEHVYVKTAPLKKFQSFLEIFDFNLPTLNYRTQVPRAPLSPPCPAGAELFTSSEKRREARGEIACSQPGILAQANQRRDFSGMRKEFACQSRNGNFSVGFGESGEIER